MKTEIITELVQFKALETTTDEKLNVAVNNLNGFLKSLDGFIDAELVKNLKENLWHIVFHFANFEKVQEIGPVLRNNKVFTDFTSLIMQESLDISFHHQIMKW
jgi:hypothetical protein